MGCRRVVLDAAVDDDEGEPNPLPEEMLGRAFFFLFMNSAVGDGLEGQGEKEAMRGIVERMSGSVRRERDRAGRVDEDELGEFMMRGWN